MSFTDLLGGLDAAVSDHLCETASWTPTGATEPVAIRVQPVDRNVIDPIGSSGLFANSTQRQFMASVADVEAAAPGKRPAKGNLFVFGGETLRIFGDPRREDEGRRWWTFEAAPA